MSPAVETPATPRAERTPAARRVPRGPRRPAALQTFEFVRGPIAYFERNQRRYGDWARARFLGYGESVWVCDPAVISKIFTGDPKALHAGEVAEWMEPGLGSDSLVLLDEDVHLRHRRLLHPPLHGEAVKRYRDIILDVAAREIETWPLRTPFAIKPRMQRIALEVLMRAVFGIDDDRRIDELRRPLLKYNRSFNWLGFGKWARWSFAGRGPWAEFERRRDAVDALIYKEIRRRRSEAAAGGKQDVLAILTQARDDDGGQMSDQELRDEMITLLMAGHLTTAVTLSWAIHFLLHNPRAYDRTRSTLAAGDDSYLDAVVKETLRMRPAVPLVARVLQRPFEFDGYRLPAGTLLAIPIMLVHHLERLFPEPHAFRPERFIGGGPEPSHYIPYGRGIRRCIGAGLADYELRLVLRTILERTTMRAPEPELEQPRGLGMPTIVPAKGARVTMLDRNAA